MVGPHYRYTSAAFLATLLVVLLCAQRLPASAADQSPAAVDHPDLATLVKRIVQAELQNRGRASAYSVVREYKVFSADTEHPRTEVLATINFLPPNLKSYDIERSTGGMGEKVVRNILDHEVDATRDPRMMSVNEQNYRFDYEGEETLSGRPCYRLTITPKHERKDLLRARIWVEKNGYRILRMEGEPAKSPSFWVKDVYVVLSFGEVAGMWLQTGTQAFARLRFGGEYKLVSNDLDYEFSRAVAMNARRRHAAAMMAASVR
ncbi:MAG TPA: hypothetical protein VG498_17625 [Terriglobales bacterium]|nr:hypothetical protein [Terriglobales bacterium]